MRVSATVHEPWQTVLGRLVRTLRQKGFEAKRTFDLRLAGRLLASGEAGPCPHHGTAPCSCQYLVLQISSADRIPSVVVIHGYDRITTISSLTGSGKEATRDLTNAMHETFEHLRMTGDARRRAAGDEGGKLGAHQLAPRRQKGGRRKTPERSRRVPLMPAVSLALRKGLDR